MPIILYKASDMKLRIHVDALHLYSSRAHIRVGVNPYLRDNSDGPPNNVSINTIYKIMGNIIGLAAEAKIGYTYTNYQYAFPLITCLINMGNPQPPTKLQIDTTTT